MTVKENPEDIAQRLIDRDVAIVRRLLEQAPEPAFTAAELEEYAKSEFETARRLILGAEAEEGEN